jgi:hypothetical protein
MCYSTKISLLNSVSERKTLAQDGKSKTEIFAHQVFHCSQHLHFLSSVLQGTVMIHFTFFFFFKKRTNNRESEILKQERGLKKEDKHRHMHPPIPLSCFHEIEITSSITSSKTNWSSAKSFVLCNPNSIYIKNDKNKNNSSLPLNLHINIDMILDKN